MSLKTYTSRIIAAALTATGAWLTPALIAAFALTQPACFVFGSSGPSMVGQGKKYQSGNPQFDEYFAELFDLQVEMSKAPAREKEIRQDLAKITNSDPDASATMLAKKVEKRAKDLAEAGTGLALTVEGADGDSKPTVAFEVTGKELSADDKSYFETVEKVAKDEAELLGRMRKLTKELERMRALSIALDQQVDNAFRKGGPSKKSEVRKNLEDSRTLMPLMASRATETSEASKTALKKLAEAIATKDSFKKEEPPPPPPVEEGAPATPDPDAKPPAKDKPKPKSGGGSTPPPPPPPPDFEP
jgi:hypothetical protein